MQRIRHWKSAYASKNEHEWFAEITKLYFRAPVAAEFYDPLLSRGRAWLLKYDPEACAFVEGLYGGKIDPGHPRLATLQPGPGRAEGKLRSGGSTASMRLLVRNRSAASLRIVWLDFDGARDKRPGLVDQPPLVPGGERIVFTRPTHVWLFTDLDGRPLCTAVAPESDARLEITGRCE